MAIFVQSARMRTILGFARAGPEARQIFKIVIENISGNEGTTLRNVTTLHSCASPICDLYLILKRTCRVFYSSNTHQRSQELM